ncbi:MAG: zinc ribbon domain-containing protein [Candidatus Bipolaricaulia bacterium]
MPIYEYQCLECGEKFEKLVRSMNNPTSEVKCPKCGGRKVEKAFSAFGIRISSSASVPVCPTCTPKS